MSFRCESWKALTKHVSSFYFQIAIIRKGEGDVLLFELNGAEALGSCLEIQPSSDDAPELSKCSIQWYRMSGGGKKELISGNLHPIICLM